MPSAKVTRMTFTFSNRLAGIVNKKSRRREREFIHCDQIQCRHSENPSVTDESKRLILRKTQKWLEWTQSLSREEN